MDIICNQESGSQRAIQYAIDALPPEGGRVIVPAGTWESGPIRLRSNVELHLESGADVWFTSDPADYLPPVRTRHVGIECISYAPLIYADHAGHVAITGSGTFHGNGPSWFHTSSRAYRLLRQEAAFRTPVENRVYTGDKLAFRPSLMEFRDCSSVLLRDFGLEDSPLLSIHLLYCREIHLYNITAHTGQCDGLYIDSSSQVQVENCHFYDGRNGIVVGAGWREDGRRVNLPCSQVEIRHCYFSRTRAGIVLGPSLAGGIDTLLVRRCLIQDAVCGILCHLPSNAGGWLRDCRFEYMNIHDSRQAAICINGQLMTCTLTGPLKSMHTTQKPPLVERLSFHTIFGDRNQRDCDLSGLTPDQQKGIIFDDLELNPPAAMLQAVEE